MCLLQTTRKVTGCQMPRLALELRKLEQLLRDRKIADLADLKRSFEGTSERTIFRGLKQLSYCTSYTHGSRFFTLDETACFDDDGLWTYDSVWFSQHGTLRATLEAWVNTSENGYFAGELKRALHTNVSETLLRLVNSGRIVREKTAGLYLYCSANRAQRRRQVSARSAELAAQDPTDELKAAILLFFALLDEQQRRLFAGLESMRHGRGGDVLVARLVGVDVHTVAKGRKQLLVRDVDMERVRTTGGGRHPKKAQRSSRRSKT